MSRKAKILSDSIIYTVSTLFSQICGVLTSILTRRYLTPEIMGIWASLMLFVNYASFAHLGLFTAVEIRVPYLKGKGLLQEIQRVRETSIFFCSLINLIILIILFALSYRHYSIHSDASFVLGMRMMSLIVVATLFYNLYIGFMRADKDFRSLSWSLVINSLFMLVLVIALVSKWSINGMYLATAVSSAASVLFLIWRSRYKLRLHFDKEIFFSLGKIGMPFFVAGFVYTFLLSIDKLIIIKMLGMQQLGFYSIAILVMSYTSTFPKIFGIVMTPNVQEEYGKTDSVQHIMKYVRNPAEIMALFIPVLLAAAYFMMPIIVQLFMPKYILGIQSMKLLLVGCFFISLTPLAHNFFVAVNQPIKLALGTLFAAGAGWLTIYFLIKSGYGIEGVAVGTSFAYFAYFAFCFCYALKNERSIKKLIMFFMKVLFPFIFSATIVFLTDSLLISENIICDSIVKMVIFLILYLPFLLFMDKKTRALKGIISAAMKVRFLDLPDEHQI